MIDLGQAQLTVDGDGTVTVDDPDSPLLVTVRLDRRRRIDHLTVAVRHPSGRIDGTTLSRIPVGQIERLARTIVDRPVDEAWMATLARPKPSTSRSWGQDHWARVAQVATWARRNRRPGGAGQAIVDLWGVSTATASRWMANARTANAGRRTPGRTSRRP